MFAVLISVWNTGSLEAIWEVDLADELFEEELEVETIWGLEVGNTAFLFFFLKKNVINVHEKSTIKISFKLGALAKRE